jgi:hypothetical protein
MAVAMVDASAGSIADAALTVNAAIINIKIFFIGCFAFMD